MARWVITVLAALTALDSREPKQTDNRLQMHFCSSLSIWICVCVDSNPALQHKAITVGNTPRMHLCLCVMC